MTKEVDMMIVKEIDMMIIIKEDKNTFEDLINIMKI